MSGSNEDIVRKALETGDFNFGGRLNRTQQDEFVKLVKDNATLLPQARFVQMPTSRHSIDRMWIGEPVTRGVGEKDPAKRNAKAKFNQIRLDAHKTKSDWEITTETLQENIEQGNFEDTLMTMMAKRISTDMELLAIQGDTGVATGTPLGDLLSTLDGWDKQTDAAHIVDAGGSGVGKSLFAQAVRRMPQQYLNDPDLHWIMSRTTAIDWMEAVSDRETAQGDKALRGASINPYGFPVLAVPNIPTTKPVNIGADVPAEVVATEFGPYEITAGVNDEINIGLDGGIVQAAATYTIPPGVYTVVELIAALRALFPTNLNAGLKLFDDGQGRLVIQSVEKGAFATGVSGARIILGAPPDSAHDELGIPESTNTDSADSNGTANEGTFILLANPKNLIFGMVDDTRVYSEFDKDEDCVGTVVYNQVAVNIENLEAIVKIVNVRSGAFVSPTGGA